MQFLTIIRIVGILVMSFSVTMLLPAFVALIYGDGGGREFYNRSYSHFRSAHFYGGFAEIEKKNSVHEKVF
ncbi:trk-type K+ transport system, membrane component [Actinobacillus equuli]|nr:trk-type K+ transport system, membrane component [Actinobacillus equuli]